MTEFSALQLEARRLRRDGFRMDDIGRQLHKGRDWVRKAIVGIPPPAGMQQHAQYQTPPPFEPDRRTLTGKLCGDPVFERSALYMKRRAGANA